MVDTPNAANISNISNLNSLQQPIWTHFSSSDSTLPAVFNVTGNSQSSPARYAQNLHGYIFLIKILVHSSGGCLLLTLLRTYLLGLDDAVHDV